MALRLSFKIKFIFFWFHKAPLLIKIILYDEKVCLKQILADWSKLLWNLVSYHVLVLPSWWFWYYSTSKVEEYLVVYKFGVIRIFPTLIALSFCVLSAMITKTTINYNTNLFQIFLLREEIFNERKSSWAWFDKLRPKSVKLFAIELGVQTCFFTSKNEISDVISDWKFSNRQSR